MCKEQGCWAFYTYLARYSLICIVSSIYYLHRRYGSYRLQRDSRWHCPTQRCQRSCELTHDGWMRAIIRFLKLYDATFSKKGKRAKVHGQSDAESQKVGLVIMKFYLIYQVWIDPLSSGQHGSSREHSSQWGGKGYQLKKVKPFRDRV